MLAYAVWVNTGFNSVVKNLTERTVEVWIYGSFLGFSRERKALSESNPLLLYVPGFLYNLWFRTAAPIKVRHKFLLRWCLWRKNSWYKIESYFF